MRTVWNPPAWMRWKWRSLKRAVSKLRQIGSYFLVVAETVAGAKGLSRNNIANGRRGARFSVLWRASARHLPMTARPWAEAHGFTLKHAPLGLSAPRRWQCYFLTSPNAMYRFWRVRLTFVVAGEDLPTSSGVN